MKVRSANAADAARILRIYAYYVQNTAITFEYEIPTADEFASRVANTLQKYPYIVLEEDGEIKGYAYADVFKDRAAYSRSCEVSIYVDHDSKGKGYGRALYEELEERLRNMGILNLYACIADPPEEDEYLTKASERFHARIGFVRAGTFHGCAYKFGRWYNMIWMEKIMGERDRRI